MGRAVAADQAQGWAAWKDRFLEPDGRVVDRLQDDASHSEGQGYGMLLAQAAGDRDAFARMEDWADRVLAVRGDGLMAWRWLPGQGVTDRTNATDGDLFRAWALWRAEHQSGWAEAAGRAGAVVAALAGLCLARDPRTADEPLLTPSAESPRGAGGVLVNPSYIMPRALRELGAAHGRTELIRAADHGETILAELDRDGLVPDWTLVTAAGFRDPGALSSLHGYDALRVALFLAWSGRAAHPAVQSVVRFLGGAGDPMPTVAGRDGTVLTRSTYRGYAALRALLLCEREPAWGPSGPYYPATLGLMAEVAWRESGACPG